MKLDLSNSLHKQLVLAINQGKQKWFDQNGVCSETEYIAESIIKNNLLVEDTHYYRYTGLADKHVIRKFVVSEIFWDSEQNISNYINLKKTGEDMEYGTKDAAIKYAKQLYNIYVKNLKCTDVVVHIQEIPVK